MGHLGGGGVHHRGRQLFPVRNFDVEKGGKGGEFDVVHNQGVWERGVHGWVMVVHKNLMFDV